MNEIVSYFTNIPSSHRSLILVGGITFFWIIENTFPLFPLQLQKMGTCSNRATEKPRQF